MSSGGSLGDFVFGFCFKFVTKLCLIKDAVAPVSSNALRVTTSLFFDFVVFNLIKTIGLTSSLGFLEGLPTRRFLREKIHLSYHF